MTALSPNGRQPARTRIRLAALLVLAVALAAACGSETTTSGPDAGAATTVGDAAAGDETLFPDVVAVEITPVGGDEFDVATTLSSPYDSPERYADAWRVLDEDGNELGIRELTHDHASEQPFTRSQTVTIPADVAEITVEGRDQVSGYGGDTQTVPVPDRS